MTDLVCMLGHPGSGKTSFLASLYELVSHDDIPGTPTLLALPADRQHLQQIHERWLKCEPALRTKDAGLSESIRFDLAVSDTEQRSIAVPDIAGGAVRTLWEERRWTNGLDELVQSAADVLLFLRADDIVPPRRVQRVVAADSESVPVPEPNDEPDVAHVSFNPEKSPTQVKLVDLLEATVSLNGRQPLGVAIVVSAWDRVQDQNVEPHEFLRMRLPLLWQYLTANPELVRFRAFGISAQGGDFSSEDDVERLLAMDQPSHRALVVDGNETSNDVSRPLRWLWASR